jgi:tetratricopeptide (TPR) repeat protein
MTQLLFTLTLTLSSFLFAESAFAHPHSDSTTHYLNAIYNGKIVDTTQFRQMFELFQDEYHHATAEAVPFFEEGVRFSKQQNWETGVTEGLLVLIAHYNNHDDLVKSEPLCRELIARQLTNPQPNDKLGGSYLALATCFIQMPLIDSSFHYIKLAEEEFIRTDNETKLGALYFLRGRMNRSISNNKAAIEDSKLGMAAFAKVGDSLSYADCVNDIGVIYYDQFRHGLALEQFMRSQGIWERHADTFGLAVSAQNIANIYRDIKEFDKALHHYEAAVEHYLVIDITWGVAGCYNNIGLLHSDLKDYDKALEYLHRGLELRQLTPNPTALSDSYLNIGSVYLEKGMFNEAIIEFERSRTIKEKLKDIDGLAKCELNLGTTKLKAGSGECLSHYNKALELLENIDAYNIEAEVYEGLLLYYLSVGNMELSSKYLKLKDLADDSTWAMKKTAHLNTLKSQFELAQKEQELLLSENEKQVQNLKLAGSEAENERISVFQIYLGIGMSLALIVTVVIARALIQKRRANDALREQQKLLNEKNLEILSSKEYAESMERMLLQQMNPHLIFNMLNSLQSIVLYKGEDAAHDFILKSAQMLRRTLNDSRKQSIALEDEIAFLKEYVGLHQFNSEDKIDLQFDYDELDETNKVRCPPMLVQPFIENALLHGLSRKTNGPKILKVVVNIGANHLDWTIEDNGIGRAVATLLDGGDSERVSHGTEIISDRIKWMKHRHKDNFSITYTDLEENGEPAGTRVLLRIPVLFEK